MAVAVSSEMAVVIYSEMAVVVCSEMAVVVYSEMAVAVATSSEIDVRLGADGACFFGQEMSEVDTLCGLICIQLHGVRGPLPRIKGCRQPCGFPL
mmetsp:Transcript_40670/g.107758  ORF Transcript_40670/g.107758 Transcript_40670/m.107758 type:complete len:95 (+) Transcript_40670:1137-1421(+)